MTVCVPMRTSLNSLNMNMRACFAYVHVLPWIQPHANAVPSGLSQDDYDRFLIKSSLSEIIKPDSLRNAFENGSHSCLIKDHEIVCICKEFARRVVMMRLETLLSEIPESYS